MVLPDLPKDVYKHMESKRAEAGLTQWQYYIMGLYAIDELNEAQHEKVLGYIKTGFEKPAIQTFKPRWKPKS